jgi:small subunit ribosomal protein S2
MRAVHLYSELVASAVLDGLQAELSASGIDIGARAELPAELPDEIEGADEPVGDASFTEAVASETAEAEATPAAD